MIRLSACIEMLFAERPFIERIAAAKAAGFDGFEFWGWADKDMGAIKAAMAASKLPCAGFALATRDAARGKAYADGCMLRRKNASVYVEMVEESAEAAKALGVATLITTVGNELTAISRGAQQDSIVECLIAAAPVAKRHGVTLVLEPLNIAVDHKGYYLSTSAQAFEILEAVNSPNVKMLFDIYHQQITEGNVIDNLTRCVGRIGHFHLADVPGRHEPGSGEIDYRNVFRALREAGYERYVGLEYQPRGDTDATLRALYAIAGM